MELRDGDVSVCSLTAVAWRLQAVQDGLCLSADWAGALPAREVGVEYSAQPYPIGMCLTTFFQINIWLFVLTPFYTAY